MKYSDNSSTSPPSKLLSVVASIYLIGVFYGSWVPLLFTPQPLTDALQLFLALPFSEQSIESKTDWATNFLLLIPLTFLWAQRFAQNQAGISDFLIRSVIAGLGIAVAFSLEFSQIFFATRTVSQKDVLALSLGALVGVAAQYRWGAAFGNWLGMLWQRESQQRRLIRLLQVYLLVLFAFNVLPLDLTISPVELYHKWKEGKVVFFPFAGLKGGVFDNLYEIGTDLLVWIPIGIFLTLDRQITLFKVALIGWLAGAAIETAQLFVYSRVTDITDILLAGLGAALGGILTKGGRRKSEYPDAKRPIFWFSLWAGWVVATICLFWFPFDFHLASISPEAVLSPFTRIPFLMLYQGSELNAVNETLRKIGIFMPGGILWICATHAAGASGRAHRTIGGISIGIVAVLIEFGQVFLPGKHADLTDALIMLIGGILGMMATRWVISAPIGPRVPHIAEEISSPPPVRKPLLATHSAAKLYLIAFAALALSISVIVRMPFVPYNVRELIAPGIFGLVSVVGLSLCILWQTTGHSLFLSQCKRKYGSMIFLPLWLLAHGAISWLLLRVSVPMESLHDIVGTPILQWPWETELIVRYLALNAAVALQILGATVTVSVMAKHSRPEDLIGWLAWTIILAWPLHWGIVVNAATDNLTELMRNGGSFQSSMLLAGGLLAFALSGSLWSHLMTYRKHALSNALIIFVTAICSAICLWFGMEEVILKYGKVFSAWQFLLSPDRNHYVSESALFMRFAIVFGGTLMIFSMIHMLSWKTSNSSTPVHLVKEQRRKR